MSGLDGVELGRMQREELPLAAGVAARAMRDNPSMVALFGPDPVRRVRSSEPLYHWILSAQQRPPLVARRNEVIVGLAALSPPGQCFYRQVEAGERALQVGTVRVGIPSVPMHLLLPRTLRICGHWRSHGGRHAKLVHVEVGARIDPDRIPYGVLFEITLLPLGTTSTQVDPRLSAIGSPLALSH